MPGKHPTKAEVARAQKIADLRAIFQDPTATPADRLKAHDRLEKLEPRAKAAPKPEKEVPTNPYDRSPAEIKPGEPGYELAEEYFAKALEALEKGTELPNWRPKESQ